jgi:hypothetical protein
MAELTLNVAVKGGTTVMSVQGTVDAARRLGLVDDPRSLRLHHTVCTEDDSSTSAAAQRT